jgi:hypothetical protein
MKNKTAIFVSCLALLATLSACGVEQAVKRNDDRYMQPGALDGPLTGFYDTYRIKFLDKYRVTHQWPVMGNCKYSKLPTLGRKNDRYKGEIYAVDDIYEDSGSTKQRGAHPKWNFDRFIRSVKVMNPVYGQVNGVRQKTGEEEIEAGLQSLCFNSWYATSHSLVMRLHKRDQKTWKAQWTQFNPKGKWSEQRVAGNVWTVQEVPEQELSPPAPGASGGWFQSWLLPIGDTGYTISLQLGASQESMQHPEAHARMKAMFHQLIESVKIEPLRP